MRKEIKILIMLTSPYPVTWNCLTVMGASTLCACKFRPVTKCSSRSKSPCRTKSTGLVLFQLGGILLCLFICHWLFSSLCAYVVICCWPPPISSGYKWSWECKYAPLVTEFFSVKIAPYATSVKLIVFSFNFQYFENQ